MSFNFFYNPAAAGAGQDNQYETFLNEINNSNGNANNNNAQQQLVQQQNPLQPGGQQQQGQSNSTGGGGITFPLPPQYQQQLNQLQQQHFQQPQQNNQPQQQQTYGGGQQQQQPQQQQMNTNQQQQVQLQAQLQAQAQLQVQQQQQLHQQIQQQAQQIQQLTNASQHNNNNNNNQQQQQNSLVAVPPPMRGDPTGGLLGTGAADLTAAGVELAEAFQAHQAAQQGRKRQRALALLQQAGNNSHRGRTNKALEEEEEEDDNASFDDDDDDDDDDGGGAKRQSKRSKTGKAGSSKLSRRQQPPKTSITRTRYSNDFKMRVVQEIEEPGYGTIADISKHYGVAEQTLRDWSKNKYKISQAVQRRGNMKANPVNHLEHVTNALLRFMDEFSQTCDSIHGDTTITARMIAEKGQEIKRQILEADAREPFLSEASRKATKKFSASLSWGKKWVRQYAKPAKTTQVPQNLEGLSKEELVRLLRSVASEREALTKKEGSDDAGNYSHALADHSQQHPQAAQLLGGDGSLPQLGHGRDGTYNPKKILPDIPSPPRVKPSAVYKVDQAKTRIAETLASLIKKKGHNWKGRPTAEMTEEVPTLENVRELFDGYPEVNKTARSYRWQLSGEQIVEWLGCPKYVHPVKFDGKVVCTIGQNASVYAFAGYDSMLAKYEQGTNTLTLKVKTFTAGTGNIPGCDEPVFLCT